MLGSEYLNHIENPTSIMRFGKPEFFNAATTFVIDQMNLSDCKGVVNPPKNYFTENVYDPTDTFTPTEQFSPSNDFSKSEMFTFSDKFAPSNTFSETEKFSKTELFSNSNIFSGSQQSAETSKFTNSNMFSISSSFIPSQAFSAKSEIMVKIKIDDKSESSKILNNAKIGIGVGAGAGAAVIGLVITGLLLLKRRNAKVLDISEEKADFCEEPETVMTNKNPLLDIMSDDDPFEKEFE